MYQMLLGQTPFRGEDDDEVYDAILEDEPLYPITMPKDVVSILQKARQAPGLENPILTYVIAPCQRSSSETGCRT
jgi:hypothetical protein